MYDVTIVGAGNAALCAAIAAAESGAKTLVLEKATEANRGGNSFFSGGLFRFPFDSIDDIDTLIGGFTPDERARVEIAPYPRPAFHDDIMRVTDGLSDPELARILVDNSYDTARWMTTHGVRFVPAYGRQAFEVDGKLRFWGNLIVEAVGAGPGLIDSLFEACDRLNIDIAYDTMGDQLLTDSKGAITGIRVRNPDGISDIETRSVVLACGGFESNPEMRVRYLGPGWDLAKVRGTAANTGDGHRMAFAAGAQPFGNYSGCHAVAWDAGAPPFGDRRIGDLFQKHSYPLGIVVNRDGHRFLDEGADFRNYTYARYGKEIIRQPGRIAFQIFDQQVIDNLRDEYHIREVMSATADTIPALAEALDIDPTGLQSTVDAYNAAVQDTPYNPAILDGKSTTGIHPPKSNWALPLDHPPYVGYAVTCGITFTFGGLRINASAQVIDTQNRPIPGLYAAGELIGGLFYENYPGGTGLMTGSTFGRLAGQSAASAT